MFRELELIDYVKACSLYETVNVILERKMELETKTLFEQEVDMAVQMVEKRLNDSHGDGIARFYLNKVTFLTLLAFAYPSCRFSSFRLDEMV